VPEGEYGPSTYGDRIAELFDRSFVPDDEREAARFLARLAGSGPALELGIGTGRVALPLARRGVEVHGIDASEAMVAKLREKRGGRDIPVTIGDLAAASVKGRYRWSSSSSTRSSPRSPRRTRSGASRTWRSG
jgi:SAM-dependent methyltransferase